MKTLIVYRSMLGSSKNYAMWLGRSLGAKIIKYSEVKNKELADYDQVILVGGTYVGWMSLDGFIRKKWDYLKGKKLILADVGLAEKNSPETQKSWGRMLPEFREKATMYKVPGKIGRLNEENVSEKNIKEIVDFARETGKITNGKRKKVVV
jgi:menaquinone-dependent protoporphyrinogen IX oxidase